MILGGLLTFATFTDQDCLTQAGGVALSQTSIVNAIVLPPCVASGVHLISPVLGSIEAFLGDWRKRHLCLSFGSGSLIVVR